MKNLLIYINPVDKQFSREHEELTRIQVDNSLSLGWKKKDLMVVTNFAYKYKGIRSIIVDNYEVFDQNRSTKIPAIIELFRKNLIADDIYWFHDHDAFQLVPFKINLKKDAGFTDHGLKSKTWNAGSFFFKQKARDIFTWIWEYMNKRGTNEQNALTYMWQNNLNNINKRYELLSIAYNIGISRVEEGFNQVGVPAKVAHFHPHKKRHLELFRDKLPPRLLKIFNQYGIK